MLGPLFDSTLGDGDENRPDDRGKLDELLETIKAAPGGHRQIRCPVATIPDPVRTSNSCRFDEALLHK